MRIVYILVSTLAIVLNSIKSTSQFERSHIGDHILSDSRGGPSSFSSSPERNHVPERLLNPVQPTALPIRLPSLDGNGCGIEQLAFIRLIPYVNLHRTFELRKYTFPVDKSIKVMKAGLMSYKPVPTEEQIVLSTSNGDVFAILETYNVLSGIYKYIGHKIKRVKINMESHTISELNREELSEIKIGTQQTIIKNFVVQNVNARVNNNLLREPRSSIGNPIPGVSRGASSASPSSERNHLPERSVPSAKPNLNASSRSPSAFVEPNSRSIDLPPRLPSPDGNGCGIEQLEFIRLIPHANSYQTFELRRYTFPDDKSIKIMKARLLTYWPVPIEEQIVLSTSNGDVYAILETYNVLSGIYKYIGHKTKRVKINMERQTITELNREEVTEIPVGAQRTILKNFKVQNINSHVNNNFVSNLRLPIGNPISGISRGKYSSSEKSNLPERSLSPAQPSLRARSRSPSALVDSRSRSIDLPIRLPSPDGNGCGIEQLEFIRLIPHVNSYQTIELRKYAFPADKSLKIMRAGLMTYRPVPTEEQIVLSTSNGDVFAILENCNVLSGIYKHIGHKTKRVKINIENQTITELNQEEVNEIPVGAHRTIMKSFAVKNINPSVNNNILRNPRSSIGDPIHGVSRGASSSSSFSSKKNRLPERSRSPA